MKLKQKLNHSSYSIAKKALFQLEPETAHNLAIKTGRSLSKSELIKNILKKIYKYESQSLQQTLAGIKFKNPIGLSAGFDKNAELIDIMEPIGFGFVEVGSITAKPCSGNQGKRLERIPEKQALWINLGLNNEGVEKIHSRLKNRKFPLPVGISIAKTNCKETADDQAGLQDYIKGIKTMQSIGDYITINISCPNAYGGQPFSNPKLLEKLLKEIQKLKIKKPIFIKLSPDLTKQNTDKIISLALKHKISGLICTNLTKKHKNKSGGLSGKILEKKSDELLKYVYKKTKHTSLIRIGVGGISSPEDAYKKIKLGANLLQLITGMIYHGPSLIGEINHGLAYLLEKDGHKNISEAVGKDVK